jgi:hypothetical protein
VRDGAAARPAEPAGDVPRHMRSLALGIAAAAMVALVMALMRAVLDLSVGLLAVAAFGGWAIGVAVLRGAWGRRPHPPGSRGVLVALTLGAGTWVAWLVLTWLVALAIRPATTLPFLERVAETPFLDYILPQLGLLEAGALVLLVAGAGYGARDR